MSTCTAQTLWIQPEGKPLRLVCDLGHTHEGDHRMTIWRRFHHDICIWRLGGNIDHVRVFDDFKIKETLDRLIKVTA